MLVAAQLWMNFEYVFKMAKILGCSWRAQLRVSWQHDDGRATAGLGGYGFFLFVLNTVIFCSAYLN